MLQMFFALISFFNIFITAIPKFINLYLNQIKLLSQIIILLVTTITLSTTVGSFRSVYFKTKITFTCYM